MGVSTLTVELAGAPDLREGDEVTIRARVVGKRLVAEDIQTRPAETEADLARRRAALQEFLLHCEGSIPSHWTDDEIERARYEHLAAKHPK
jgi:hypothetical protein